MARTILHGLSRRERQVLETVYRLDGATARAVRADLTDPPSYSAIRAHLRILEEKGLLRHERHGRQYVYHPTVPKGEVRRSALRTLVDTFFGGSVAATVVALLEEEGELSEERLQELETLISQAREEA